MGSEGHKSFLVTQDVTEKSRPRHGGHCLRLRTELQEKLQSQCEADKHRTKQRKQRREARCLRQLLGWRGGLRDRCALYGWGGLYDLVNFHFFLVGRDGHDRNRLQRAVVKRVGSNGWNDYLRRLRQLNGTDLGINEFLPEVVARIEPSAKSFRRIARSLIELHYGCAGRLQAVVIDSEDRGDDLAAVCIKDLNDVTVGRRV